MHTGRVRNLPAYFTIIRDYSVASETTAALLSFDSMRQRLGIAKAIMEDPDIIVLDEPMNGLDCAGVGEICKLLLDMRQSGKTILLASHNKEDIDELCDEVYRMESGKLQLVI